MGESPATWNSELPTQLSIDLLRDFAMKILTRQTFLEKSLQDRQSKLVRLVKESYTDTALVAVAGWEPDLKLLSTLDRDIAVAFLRMERQVSALFSKLTFGSIDRKAVALKGFLRSEDLCRDTNHILRAARRSTLSLRPSTASALYRAKQLISRVLGDVPTLEGMDIRFGPGATTSIKRHDASYVLKCLRIASCAAPLYNRIGTIMSGAPHLLASHLRGRGPSAEVLDVRVTPAVWDSVPKNFKTERGICKEPDLNVVVQGYLGRCIQKRLVDRVGIDIRDQTRNQRAAFKASLSGDIATLDLSAASDSIATELVYELLPLEWASLLASARSDVVRLPDGSTIRQEKFSSMGNGFTFPLETLIFWGLSTAAMSEGSALVYGDDIIVPTRDALNVISVLSDLGFAVNKDKSFYDESILFRESCGCDFFGGYDVRPVYVRGSLSRRRMATLFNFFAEVQDWDACAFWYKHLQDAPHGPPGYGDGHLHWSPFTSSDPRVPYKRDRGYEGFAVKSYRSRPRRSCLSDDFVSSHSDILMSALLYALEVRPDGLPGLSPTHQDEDGFTVSVPGVDDNDPNGDSYHLKRLVVNSELPSYTYTALQWYKGRTYSVRYETGKKPHWRLTV